MLRSDFRSALMSGAQKSGALELVGLTCVNAQDFTVSESSRFFSKSGQTNLISPDRPEIKYYRMWN